MSIPLFAKNYYYFFENRKIYFLSPETVYKGRVHADLSTTLSSTERQFCEDFDRGKLKPVFTGGMGTQSLLGASSVATQNFFSPMQCGDGDPKMNLNTQLKQEAVFERIAVMCDQSQVPNCVRYAVNSQWAKARWVDATMIKTNIDETFSQGMEARIKDFLALGGNLRATNNKIPCMLFRNEKCGDILTLQATSNKYKSFGEEWFMTQAVNCDAHLISPCIFNALYSTWAKTKWPTLAQRKKELFSALKKSRENRVNAVVKASQIKLPKLF
jgi:hypothetical protein